MPFVETNRVKEREAMMRAWASGLYGKSELGRRFGVSRPTVDLWLDRGEAGEELADRSRAPHSHPNQIEEAIIEQLRRVRRAHPSWGPKKIGDVLRMHEPQMRWPADSTIGDVLKRAGLVEPRKRVRNSNSSPGPTLATPNEPGQVTTGDFKGQFRLRNRQYCYPLTAADPVSRYIYVVKALSSPTTQLVQPVLERMFREFGLPEVFLTDNGPPFCVPQALGRLSRLGVWCLKYGIDVRQTRPGHPEDNSVHERMHKSLKAAATRPPEWSLSEQQRRFDRFRREFNEERSHESLGRKTPASVHRRSSRPFPARVPEVTYPGHFELRRVHCSGQISWKGELLYVSASLAGEVVGFEEIDDGIWSLYFSSRLLGRYHARNGRIL